MRFWFIKYVSISFVVCHEYVGQFKGEFLGEKINENICDSSLKWNFLTLSIQLQPLVVLLNLFRASLLWDLKESYNPRLSSHTRS